MADSLFETTFRVGEVVDAEPFEEARKPELAKLQVDLGDEVVVKGALASALTGGTGDRSRVETPPS